MSWSVDIVRHALRERGVLVFTLSTVTRDVLINNVPKPSAPMELTV